MGLVPMEPAGGLDLVLPMEPAGVSMFYFRLRLEDRIFRPAPVDPKRSLISQLLLQDLVHGYTIDSVVYCLAAELKCLLSKFLNPQVYLETVGQVFDMFLIPRLPGLRAVDRTILYIVLQCRCRDSPAQKEEIVRSLIVFQVHFVIHFLFCSCKVCCFLLPKQFRTLLIFECRFLAPLAQPVLLLCLKRYREVFCLILLLDSTFRHTQEKT